MSAGSARRQYDEWRFSHLLERILFAKPVSTFAEYTPITLSETVRRVGGADRFHLDARTLPRQRQHHAHAVS